MRNVTVASVQMSMADDLGANIAAAEALIRDAAGQGAQIVLIPELFEGPYFCIDQLPEHFDRARPLDGHPTVEHFQAVAAELGIVLPINVYERAGQATFNTVVMIDADGTALGTYRKSHIPDGPGYTEKYYFNPGDTGFRAWRHAARRGRHRHLLGPVVPRGRPLHGVGRGRGAPLPHRDRQRTARPHVRLQATTGSGSCRATRPPT